MRRILYPIVRRRAFRSKRQLENDLYRILRRITVLAYCKLFQPRLMSVRVFFVAWLLSLMSTGHASPVPATRPAAEPLRTAAAVRALSGAEAARALPVRLEGIVLAVRENRAVVLIDPTDGIYITASPSLVEGLVSGESVIVEGVTHPGGFAPAVRAQSVRATGRQALPPPTQVSLPQLAHGGFDARWVELEGIVRHCSVEPLPTAGRWDGSPPPNISFVTLAESGARLRLRIDTVLVPSEIIDARVRVRGICFNVHNANRQFVRASLLVPSPSDFVVLSPPPTDPFALPLKRADELLQFDPVGFSGHRIHVRGVVTRYSPDDSLWIRDGDRGVQIVSTHVTGISPGDEVDVAGFVERGRYSPYLADALVRVRSRGTLPAPVVLSRFNRAVAHEANLVCLDAELIGLHPTPTGTALTLNWDKHRIHAILPASASVPPPSWMPGTRLRLTGICSLSPDASGGPNAGLWPVDELQLLLRDNTDIIVLQPAPWSTARILSYSLGGLAALLVGVLAVLWIQSRRQVAQRELERRMAEAEFAAILGERNRVARDIHDTLAQGLNAVSMQLELAKNTASRGTEAVLPYVATAHSIVRACIAEARESIWNMRSHVLERTDLAGALRGVLQQLVQGLALDARFDVVGSGRRLAPQVENDLLRIGQEGISNAIKHASASSLRVILEFEPDLVRLRITDDGRGFDTTATHRITSRFGLKGIRERVAQLSARLHLESAPGKGTELMVEIPQPRDPAASPA